MWGWFLFFGLLMSMGIGVSDRTNSVTFSVLAFVCIAAAIFFAYLGK